MFQTNVLDSDRQVAFHPLLCSFPDAATVQSFRKDGTIHSIERDRCLNETHLGYKTLIKLYRHILPIAGQIII